MVVCGLRLTGFFQFYDDRVAKPAAYSFQMKLDVLIERLGQNSQQMAAECGAGWATQPITTPNLSDGMPTLIAASHQHGKSLPHV